MATLYLAYGSNLNIRHMALRCPTARPVGSTVLTGYELLFRGSNGSAYATVEENPQGQVPALIWELDDIAEKRLDRYEGYPSLYRKEYLKVKLNTKPVEVMVYIMNGSRPLAVPERHYYESILEGYQAAGFDIALLDRAVRIAAKQDTDRFLAQERCSRCGGLLTVRSMSRMNEDVLCPDCLDVEQAHPRYQEAVKAELNQVKAGNYNYPGLFAGRRYPFRD